MDFTISKQDLTRTDSEIIVADTMKYLTVSATFSSEWDGLAISITFKKWDKENSEWLIIQRDLTDGEVTTSQDLQLTSGIWKVGFTGVSEDLTLTTRLVEINVLPSIYSDYAEVMPVVTLTDTLYLIALIQTLQNNLDALLVGEHTHSDVKGYTTNYIDSTFATLAYIYPMYFTRTGALTATLLPTKPTVNDANYMTTVNTTNTEIDWDGTQKLTITQTLTGQLYVANGNSLEILLSVAFNRNTECEYGARVFINDDQLVSDGQTSGIISYSGSNEFDIPYNVSITVTADNIDGQAEYGDGDIVTIEIFKYQTSAVPQTTRYFCGVSVNGIDKHSTTKYNTNTTEIDTFRLADKSVTTPKIDDNAVTYDKLSAEVQALLDTITP